MFRCSRSTVTSLKTTYRYSSSTSGPAPGKRFISGRSIVLTIALGTPAALYFFYPDASRSAPTSSDAPLSPSHFTPATVESTVGSGPNTKLMTLVIPPNLIPQSALGPIWSVFIKDDQIQVERPYTPLYGIDESGRMEFWIKKYPKGEVGRWLHSKAVGDTIELRGPLSTWHWKEDAWDEVIMISGGTGFTPYNQLFHSIITSSSSPKTRFTLLHSSLCPEELPPDELLAPFRRFARDRPDRLRVALHVDQLAGRNSDVVLGRIGRADIEKAAGVSNPPWYAFWRSAAQTPAPRERKIMFLICGPDTMITAIAGPFGRNLSQGPVGGILGELGFSSHQVYKLSS
ncbi:hypothetical protein BDV98DRAFT_499625 [Pterulicium gracile]|uniref:FAD-binding FR-type domain-containing protein n=1 Tax=Pterulicium gracile TaxID=1884261 RepID=A0A5C3QV38_9AGAR|nr:hypothetical protein BDV98DRAFT_499625 [Pterula gracilis]